MTETFDLLFFLALFLIALCSIIVIIISLMDTMSSFVIKGSITDIEIVSAKNHSHTDSYTITMPPPNPDLEVDEKNEYKISLKNNINKIKNDILDKNEYDSYYVGEKVKVTYLTTFLGFNYVISVNHINPN